MKTAKIHGLKLGNPAKNTHKLANSQTKIGRSVSGAPQPVVPNKVEPAVVDFQYFKNIWNKLVKFFQEK